MVVLIIVGLTLFLAHSKQWLSICRSKHVLCIQQVGKFGGASHLVIGQLHILCI